MITYFGHGSNNAIFARLVSHPLLHNNQVVAGAYLYGWPGNFHGRTTPTVVKDCLFAGQRDHQLSASRV
jgi:hypothetical protein